MNINEAREALVNTIEDAISDVKEKGLGAEYKCFLADRDLLPIEASDSEAALIAAEITVFAEGMDEKIIFECAVCIENGDVLNDEIIREVTMLRQNIKEITDKVDEIGDVKEAFKELIREEEPETVATATVSNKYFYIGAGIAALVLIAIMLLFRAL